MALDLSVKTMQSHPLDLSTKKDTSSGRSSSKVHDQYKQLSSASARSTTMGISRCALRKASSGNCTKSTTHRRKLAGTWCLKKRLLEYHREALEREEKENKDLPASCHRLCEGELVAYRAEDGELQGDCAPHQSNQAYQGGQVSSHHEFPAFPLPADPREWSRLDVRTWLQHMKMTFDLGDVHPERFPMNGKGLCLMSPEMFSYRVPDAGKLLFRDFCLRLNRAVALQAASSPHVIRK